MYIKHLIINVSELNNQSGSPTPKRWFESGGEITIREFSDGAQNWIYTNSKGNSVPYINGKVDFSEYLNPDINSVNIGVFRSRKLDAKLVKNMLYDLGLDDVLEGYVLHHSFENGVIQLVDESIHSQFSHIGGYNRFVGK